MYEIGKLYNVDNSKLKNFLLKIFFVPIFRNIMKKLDTKPIKNLTDPKHCNIMVETFSFPSHVYACSSVLAPSHQCKFQNEPWLHEVHLPETELGSQQTKDCGHLIPQ